MCDKRGNNTQEYDRELHHQVYDLMEKFAKNPSNANRYFEAVMALVEDKQRRDRDYDLESGQWEEAIRRDERQKVLSEVEKEISHKVLPAPKYGDYEESVIHKRLKAVFAQLYFKEQYN